MIRIININTFYGHIQALKNVSLHVKEQEIVVLIGANGAGKTTLLKTILGLLPEKTGAILFRGKKIASWQPSKIVAHGISLVPEGRQIFGTLSVMDNLLLGAYQRIMRADTEFQEDLHDIFDLFPALKDRKNQMAGTLSGGEQQMLAIGRGLMGIPRLQMFDEPSLGLAPLLVKEVFHTIKKINGEGTTVLVVEQNVKQTLLVANRGYVLETGKIINQGTGESLLADEHVKTAYLGV